MSAVLPPVERWTVKSLSGETYLSDYTAHTVTVTRQVGRAMKMEFTGASRIAQSLNVAYPAMNWAAAMPAEG